MRALSSSADHLSAHARCAHFFSQELPISFPPASVELRGEEARVKGIKKASFSTASPAAKSQETGTDFWDLLAQLESQSAPRKGKGLARTHSSAVSCGLVIEHRSRGGITPLKSRICVVAIACCQTKLFAHGYTAAPLIVHLFE